MKKLSELKNDDWLIVKPEGYEIGSVTKEEFLELDCYLYVEPVRVFVAEREVASFDLEYALECLEDDMHEDWLEHVLDAIPTEVRKRIEAEINGYLKANPTYYPGEEVCW